MKIGYMFIKSKNFIKYASKICAYVFNFVKQISLITAFNKFYILKMIYVFNFYKMHLFFYNLHFIIAILDAEENIVQFVYSENENI